jgi:hypothetical protein
MKGPRRLDDKTGRACFERNRPTIHRRPALVAPLQRWAGGVQLQNTTGVFDSRPVRVLVPSFQGGAALAVPAPVLILVNAW